jgi:hypothetical protein
MFRIRCSSLSRIMTEPKNKGEILSIGAKTYVEELASQHVYGFEKTFSSKECDKGLIVEDPSISLLNEVLFTNYVKNTERKTNEWLTGECDIDTGEKIIDIKSPWSLATFPATVRAGRDKDYEWQLRGYMMLWNREISEIAYCMVTTPDELIRFEPTDIHYVDHIDPTLRVTRVPYERDLSLEDKIRVKVDACRTYFEEVVQMIDEEHA